ncbi:MAG: 2Fe-2S iron-sulfur cluster-binding protein [Gammaproteobacteria bacterium]
MTQYDINIEGLDDGHYLCSDQQTLLAGMERLGKRGIPVGCRGGGCGVCKVHISTGDYRCKKMSRAHVTEQEEAEGYVLACRCLPESDIRMDVIGNMKKAVFRGQETANTTMTTRG